MLKKLLNNSERITYGRLREVCTRRAAEVYAKVRLADVLPIENSGLSVALYDFALQSHYDFVVTGRDQAPLFAVEFDGPQHGEALQARRDAKKDELSQRFGLPLFRVSAEDIARTDERLDRLTELIELWFREHALTASSNQKSICPLCGSGMVERYGKYGRFLSCVRYPACTGSSDLTKRHRRFGRERVLFACSIAGLGLAAVVAILFILPQMRRPDGAGNGHLPRATTSNASGVGSAMTLEDKLSYVSNLKDSDYPLCPSCGKQMVIRRNNRSGDPFFGCSQFPDCRGTRNVQYPK